MPSGHQWSVSNAVRAAGSHSGMFLLGDHRGVSCVILRDLFFSCVTFFALFSMPCSRAFLKTIFKPLYGILLHFGSHFGSFLGSLLGGLGGFWSIFGLQFVIICSFQDSTQNLLNFGCVLGCLAPSKMCVLYVRGLENHVSGRAGLGVLFE